MPHVLGRALAGVYARVMARRNARFDAGAGVVEFDRPVVSVGNLSVGGTGKTPLTKWLIARLREGGHWPALAMRGYRAPDGNGLGSDEAREYLRAFADLPLVARANRVEGLLELFARADGERVDCVLLDDGFQHRRIARGLDVVLLDATRDVFADRLLPAGWLREPVSSLGRAGAVVLTRADLVERGAVEAMSARVREAAPRALVASSAHAWEELVDGEGRELGVGWLKGKRVAMACAVGNPDAIERQLVDAGIGSVERIALRDHDAFDDATVARVLRACATADACVVTEKDWMKLDRVERGRWPCPVVRPRLAMRFLQGGDALLARVMGAVRAGGGPPDG
jgi:tetraacyldisaccharide 4'-kinase